MHPLVCSARRMIMILALTLVAYWPAWTVACAQTGGGTVRGEITDPSGALVPGARLALRSGGKLIQHSKSGDYGDFLLAAVPAGKYSLRVEATGFRDEEREVVVKAGETLTLSIRLKIEVERQQVSIASEEQSSSPDRNLGAVILSGSELDALATNPHDLMRQLELMAGTDLPPQFYVDGFTASRLPPKSSIQEIRMNQDPYSAEYDTPGAERVEIITKPGSDKLHGSLELFGEDSPLDSRNPYVTSQPGYSAFYTQGDVSGRINKNSSWFLTGDQQTVGSQSFVHAVTSSTGPAYTQTVSSPQTSVDAGPRVDFQAGKIHTLSIRYQFGHQTQDDLLQSQLSLPEQGINTRHTDQTLQISDTQNYGPRVVNETRFQFMRTNDTSVSLNGSASVLVQGAFNGGGNNLGQSHDGQNHYELQDYVSLLAGNHLLHFRGRFRDIEDGNTSTGGYNGQFIFPSIESYEITSRESLRG